MLELTGLVLLVIVLYHFALPPIYRFPPPQEFSGSQWSNPYDGAKGPWLRANLHAHSIAWLGAANGANPLPALWARYRELGYDVIGISNYMSIRPPMKGEKIYLPDYEHGYGAWKQHQTVIGAASVEWLDFPLYQGLRQKQFVLDTLHEGAQLVIVNHPNHKHAYSLADMSRLVGYDGIELHSRYAKGVPYWDAALSAGRLVWGFCSDDCHDMDRSSQMEVGWVMIDAAEPSAPAVIDALRSGRFFSVWSKKHEMLNELRSARIRGGVLSVEFEKPADVLRFIGKSGVVRKSVENVRAADYELRDDDSYVRVEATTGSTVLFLNPVHRWDGTHEPVLVAEIRPVATWVVRGSGLLLLFVALVLFIRSRMASRR